MDLTTLLWAAGIAATFVAWPVIGKYSGASGAWIGIIVVAGSLVTTAIFGLKELTSGPMFTLKALVLLVMAGLLNGAAVYYYSVKATSTAIPTGVFIVTMSIMMVIFAPILDWLLNGNALSIRQCAGIAAAVVAIYLLQN